jgi:hypothetical protein
MTVAEAFEYRRRTRFRDPHWILEVYMPFCGWIELAGSDGKVRTFSTQQEAENYRL